MNVYGSGFERAFEWCVSWPGRVKRVRSEFESDTKVGIHIPIDAEVGRDFALCCYRDDVPVTLIDPPTFKVVPIGGRASIDKIRFSKSNPKWMYAEGKSFRRGSTVSVAFTCNRCPKEHEEVVEAKVYSMSLLGFELPACTAAGRVDMRVVCRCDDSAHGSAVVSFKFK